MQRQTVTLNRRFLELTSELNSEDRLKAYDKILTHLFNDIPIETAGESESLKIILACLAPELRRAQVVFDNGKISKKLNSTTQASLRPFDASKKQATSEQNSNNRADNSSPYLKYHNNINNIIIILIIILIITRPYQIRQKKNELHTKIVPEEQHLESDPEKKEFFASVLDQKASDIQDVGLQSRFVQFVKKVQAEEKPFNIDKVQVLPEDVLEKMVELFRLETKQEITARIFSIFEDVDSREGLTNKFKYFVSAMYREIERGI